MRKTRAGRQRMHAHRILVKKPFGKISLRRMG
jgi:hypothetical protein